jgi:hypothetical protein
MGEIVFYHLLHEFIRQFGVGIAEEGNQVVLGWT